MQRLRVLLGAMITRPAKIATWWLLLVATTAVYYKFDPDLPIVELELAGNRQTAARLVSELGAGGVESVFTSIAWDYPFLVLYGATLLVACLWAGSVYLTGPLRSVSRTLGVLVLAAPILDYVENYGLLQTISSDVGDVWPVLSAASAYPKFFVLFLAVLYVLGAAVTRATQWTRQVVNWGPDWVRVRRDSLPDGRFLQREEHPPWQEKEAWEPTPGRIGVSCSGGGIRSAAYNLGALQALQEAGTLRRAKYLTAVSGGAYLAGAWAILWRESFPKPLGPADAFSRASPEEDYLRNNSSYLAPDLRKLMWGVGRFLLGAVTNIAFLAGVVFVVSRPLGWIIGSELVHPELSKELIRGVSVTAAMWWSIAIAGVASTGCALVTVLFRTGLRVHDRFLRVARAALVLALALFIGLAGLPWLMRTVPSVLANPSQYLPGDESKADGKTKGSTEDVPEDDKEDAFNLTWLLQALGLGTSVGAALTALLSKQKARVALAVGRIVPALAVTLGVVMISLGGALANKTSSFVLFGRSPPVLGNRPREYVWWALAALGLWVFYEVTDQTAWSIHPFYKRRLASAFALHRHPPDQEGLVVGEVNYDTYLELSGFPKPPPDGSEAGPQLVVCGAANVTDLGLTPVGRRCVSYTFSSTEVGGPDVGWIKTEDLERAFARRSGRREDVTLMAAMAISGAAFSSAMGKMKESKLGSLFALVNARLGVWLPNLRWVGALGKWRWRDRPRASYVLKELLRSYRAADRFTYVSDGGHWENLGLVELLRRGCTEIYCFDASGDKVETFRTIGQAIAIARSELNVDVKIVFDQDDPEKMLAPPGGELSRKEQKKAERERRDPRLAAKDHWWGTIQYPRPYDQVPARLVVVKLAVTKDAPWDVQAYAAADAEFPTHSTLDQLFDHEKFEAYRALGESSCQHAIESSMKSGEASGVLQYVTNVFGAGSMSSSSIPGARPKPKSRAPRKRRRATYTDRM